MTTLGATASTTTFPASASDVGAQPADSDLTAIAALTTTSYGRAFLELANAAAGRTALVLGTAAVSNTGDFDAAGAAAAAQSASQPVDSDLTAIALLTTTAFGRAFLTFANTAAVLSALSLDADLATFALPASTTISAFGATIIDDANAAATIATLGLDADLATLSLPASTTITAAAATVLDDTTTGAMLTTLGAQPVDSDLTTLAGLTATTDNMIQSVGSAWASRTPAQVKTALAIAESDVTNLVSDLALKAPLASPTLTGVPAAPTASAGTSTTQVATTAFVGTAVGAPVLATVAKTADYTVASTDSVIYVTGNSTMTIPAASGLTGKVLTFKKTDTAGTVVTLSAASLIDGAATDLLTAQYEAVSIQAFNSTWWRI